jgi:lysophospholipase L1-like esterase
VASPLVDEVTIVSTLGDSIVAGAPYWDPDPEVRATIAETDPASQWQFWVARERPELVLRNHGVGGERTDEIAARFDVAAADADMLIVQGGINDIAQAQAVAGTAANIRELLRRGRELGLRVAVANVLPWNNGWPDAERPIRELNGLIDAFAAEEGVPVLRFHDTLEDPGLPGRMRAEWTSDGNHPSVLGYRRLAEAAFRLP